MPTPHLHPRSRMTSSLFATTVIASFFVVALPHVLPCPAPRATLADGEMVDGKRRRRRKPEITAIDAKPGIAQFGSGIGDVEMRSNPRTRRECPVPKPGGMVGELLGFKKSASDSTARK